MTNRVFLRVPVLVFGALAACSQPPAADVPDVPLDAGDAGMRVDVPADMFTLPDAPPPVLPDTREACTARNANRNPYFGDLHVHTTLSFDVWQAGVRNRPADAYRFAKGESVTLPPLDAQGRGTRTVQLTRPLDFAAVTDHSEFLGEIDMCTDPTSPAYSDPMCTRYRASMPEDRFFGLFALILASREPHRTPYCQMFPGSCLERTVEIWKEVQDAAEAAYDRSSACQFTSLVGYEWTGSAGGFNLHRNVLFKNRQVPWVPTTYIEAPTAQKLWAQLDGMCRNSGTGCDALAIPHNSNLGGDRMFVPISDNGEMYSRDAAARRAFNEPLVEIFQHKGSSECLTGWPDPLALEDELCNFETVVPSICQGLPSDPPDCADLCVPGAVIGGFADLCVAKNATVRGALALGLSERQRVGANPFELGIIASTDTHNGIPASVAENNFPGHLGVADDEPQEKLDVNHKRSSPGGLAVIWAEENSREAIFSALRRRETYGTSGTRPIVRFFGGWSYDNNLCAQPDMVTQGYAGGVPMGSVLSARPTGATAPKFVVAAWKDPGTTPDAGIALQRLQVVKGYVDAQGAVHEQVFDVAGNANNGADVNAQCMPTGTGSDNLCNVWTDPAFDPTRPTYYYVRVLENPTCRWSARVCASANVNCATQPANDPLRACCDNSIPRTIQERAWSSPVWYYPDT